MYAALNSLIAPKSQGRLAATESRKKPHSEIATT